jgi:hypothetical protein
MNYKDQNDNENAFTQWGIVLDSGKYTIDKKSGNIPFFPSTPIKLR